MDLGGEPGELVVIIDDAYKNSEALQEIVSIIQNYNVGLTQNESPFKILVLSSRSVNSMFRKHRNIMYISINTSESNARMQLKRNVWTAGQCYVGIAAPDTTQLLRFFEKNHATILNYFIAAEHERYQTSYQFFPHKVLPKHIEKKFAISLSIPDSYSENRSEDNFLWASAETKDFSQGLIIYQRPYSDTAQFSRTQLLHYRDSIVKRYIPGPSEGSYMSTEYVLPVQRTVGRFIHDDYTVQLRGKWNVENDFMAGPFVSYSFVNPHTKMLITIEGYVYYPNKEKRNLLRQLEAICLSATYQ
jgi:hypothetical protein